MTRDIQAETAIYVGMARAVITRGPSASLEFRARTLADLIGTASGLLHLERPRPDEPCLLRGYGGPVRPGHEPRGPAVVVPPELAQAAHRLLRELWGEIA